MYCVRVVTTMSDEKDVLKEIVQVSNVVRKKYKDLKRDHAESQQLLEERFRPITEPLQEIVKQNVKVSEEDVEAVTPVKSHKKKKNKKARLKSRLVAESPEDPLSTPGTSSLIPPRKLEFTSPAFLDTDVIAEKAEEHSPRKIIKSLLRTPEGQKTIEVLKENYGAKFGDTAAKYLLFYVSATDKQIDNLYGIRQDQRDGGFKIGNKPVTIEHNDIIVGGKTYTGTPGLYELLIKAEPDTAVYDDHDLSNYIEIVKATNAHRRNYSSTQQLNGNAGYKWMNILKNKFPSKGRSKSVIGKGIVRHGDVMNFTNKKREYIYWNDPNELVNRLRLLLASKHAGHTGHDNEIVSIIEELREDNIIE